MGQAHLKDADSTNMPILPTCRFHPPDPLPKRNGQDAHARDAHSRAG
ncbi:hypothetical protein BJP36_41065 [Moorena producens JHB]|uniref:Uncharacterized protein n=1 Tax=Moorena producens (strain JHB) TaxID=1454205 RepID=A0A9Q9SSE2_MOOP1|nr:hypothetical protein [Moorena producens]WAN68758.1 hypothetical protein BJP36_41065 [Moorena producens JHB]